MPAAEDTQRSKLKVYLGYAAGVGKTFQMLADGQAAAQRGLDLVVAYFQPHARPDTIAQIQGLEVLPHRKIDYRERTFEEMDTEVVLRRRPQIALVDELAHTNIPGSQRAKRWEDVQVLLDAGIEVWTTMNVQHIESLNDQIWQITGIQVRETVPDWVVRQAAEIVAVDVTPEALLNRLKREPGDAPAFAQELFDTMFADLDSARVPQDMDFPGLRLHSLTGDLKGFWSVTVSANWRIIFRFDDADVVDVDLVDYH